MEITQKKFERAIEVVFRRGVVREQSAFIPDKEIRATINDVYDFLKYDINTSQSGVEADAESRCKQCNCSLLSYWNNCPLCGCSRTA